MNVARLNRVRIWDLPTRLFHWVLAVLVTGALLTAEFGAMAWHMRLGQATLVLLAFRLLWGFVGGRWSRFAGFFREPGHDWKGSASVLVMLAWLIAQVLSGMVADDEIMTAGPLRPRVSDGLSELGTHWHVAWGQWGVYALVVLHLVAVAWQVLRGRSLVMPMVTGDKELTEAAPASRDDLRSRLLALGLIALITCGYVVSIAA
ncbi:MAG: cytochrome b/b6 domain-containing protein [Paucibacter sp.]|nr:cytochrome b/b6 domain-containing protein [Roseateles sp.]